MTQASATEDMPVRSRGHDWRINLLLFGLTVITVFLAGRWFSIGYGLATERDATLLTGWEFAVPFLGILLFHEFGHWIAARVHHVRASLPYFLPMPISLFGTFGAVIVMPPRIRSRNALLDIGAAGPIAGMVVAIPTLMLGLHLSHVAPVSLDNYYQEGQSLLYMLLKRVVVGPIPEGHDVFLHPTAFAGWGGFLITMINMLPWGQLDGGHIAYALLGERHHQVARWLRYSLLLLFLYNLAIFVLPVMSGESGLTYGAAIGNSLFWLIWFGFTGLLARMSGGADHPPCEGGPLSPARRAVALGTLLMFVLLFMPTPMAVY